jgi:tellurite methyltransferase
MTLDHSVQFFDAQFRRQVQAHDFALNPFEQAALPYLRGRVLDYGSGLGNLSVALARAGCEVVALDASPTAIEHIRRVAADEALAIRAERADLRTHVPDGPFDAVVAIGLLMFFDCPTAWQQLGRLQACVRPGGVAVVNVLTEGTTYMDMFGSQGHCLFQPEALLARFDGWECLLVDSQAFPAPGGTRKTFLTVVARKPPSPDHRDGGTAEGVASGPRHG